MNANRTILQTVGLDDDEFSYRIADDKLLILSQTILPFSQSKLNLW